MFIFKSLRFWLFFTAFSYSAFVMAATIGTIIYISSFSWGSLGENEITIVDAAAQIQINPGGLFCVEPDGVCGIAFGYTTKGGGFNTLVISQGPVSSYTNTQAVAAINSLPGKVLKIPNVVSGCLYKYNKGKAKTGVTLIGGACGGGNIPPVPIPAKCELSLDNAVIDFGDITASAFSDAGVSNIPANIAKQTRVVNVSCSSPQSTMAYMRLSTTKASSNMIVSDNKDVGFIIENNGGRVTPNNNSSTIPVMLNAQGVAQVVLSAAPVSVTGKKPKAGIFSATAILEVSWQ